MGTALPKVITKVFRKSAALQGDEQGHFVDGLAKTPGAKTGRELNAPTTSRKWCPSPKPGPSAPVSVIDCIYRFDGTGSFTGTGGTWGTAKYIELYMLADDDEYSKAKTGICFVDLVQYDFVVTTRAEDPTTYEALTIDMVALTINSEALQIGA